MDTERDENLTLDTILQKFSTDEAAREFLETQLWMNGPVCPRCNSTDPRIVYKMDSKSVRAGLYNCKQCRHQFTVTVGTIFEDSHIPLRKWLVAWFLLCSSKKGISSLQLQRILGLGSYRTALFMTHRIRHALKETNFSGKLKGDVEVDETFVGGYEKRGIDSKTQKVKTGFTNKTVVVSLVQRGGQKRSMVMERVTAANLEEAIKEHVSPKARVHTDESLLYWNVQQTHEHHVINHGKKQYVIKKGKFKAHTNTVEGSFSLLKRGIVGTFHQVSKKHLPLYLAEFDFRYNLRKTTDGERTQEALKRAHGKRLTYRGMVGSK